MSDTEIKLLIAERVRKIRKSKKLSIPKLAELSGVCTRTIRRIEGHDADFDILMPSLSTLIIIAGVLDCKVKDLIPDI